MLTRRSVEKVSKLMEQTPQPETPTRPSVRASCSEPQYVHVLSFNGEVKGFTTDRLWAHEWAAQLDGRGVDAFVPKIEPQNAEVSREEGK